MEDHGRLDPAGSSLIICRQNDPCSLLGVTGDCCRPSDKRAIPGHLTADEKGIHVDEKNDSARRAPLSMMALDLDETFCLRIRVLFNPLKV